MNRRGANRGRKYPVQLNSRVTPEQMQQIRDSAEIAGMSVCKFVRHRATGSTVISKQDVQLTRELNRIGNWLVYLTKKGMDVSEAIAEVRSAIKRVKGETV